MVDIVFKRANYVNANGSVPGTLTIGAKSWPTMERGGGFTFVRKGEYTLKMDIKNTGVMSCLRFDHAGIRTHLIHAAGSHDELEGCIAPGQAATKTGITGSKKAMTEVFDALGGGFDKGKTFTITVENNIQGDETGEHWMSRRQAAGKY